MAAPQVSPREWDVGPSDVLLADGTIAVIRSLRADDRDAVLDLHENVSEDTLRLRFFTVSRTAGRRYVERLFDLEHSEQFALVALVRGRLAGLATAEVTSEDRAEVAFLVSDEDRGRGLGSLLLEHLAALGREHGLRRFDADVLPDNHGMLRVFRGAGFAVSRRTEQGEVVVELRTDVSAAALDASDRREWRSEALSLRPLLAPRSVAVVGVRRSAGGLGRAVLDAIVDGSYDGQLSVVHPAAAEEGHAIAGLPAYASIGQVPGGVELAVVVVPAEEVADVVADACEAGVGAAVIVSSGITGDDVTAGRELLARARAHSVRLVGPNSQGVLSLHGLGTLNASFARTVPEAGGLAVATQSGGVGFTVLDLARGHGVGVHSFVSLGAKLDVSSNDLLAAWGDDERVSVAALYLESFGNALKFARTARRFAERKPLLAVVGGASAAGSVGVSALFAQAGVIPCRGGADIAETAAVLTQQPLPDGFRVGVVTNAGGMGVLVAGMAEGEGLSVPGLSPGLRAELNTAAVLVGDRNPVDVGATVTPASLCDTIKLLLTSGEVDAVVATLVPTTLATPDLLWAAAAKAGQSVGRPVVVVASDGEPQHSTPGQTVFQTPLVAVSALARAMRYAAWRRVSADDSAPVDLTRAATARGWAAERLAAHGAQPTWLSADDSASLLALYGLDVGADSTGASGVALTLDVTRDESFGPMVRVAASRTTGDATPDEVHLLAPAAPTDAARALRSLRLWPLLDGERGPERVDLIALESLVVAAGRLAADVPQLARLELGPVLARPAGVLLTGARLLLTPAESADTGFPRRLRPS